MKKNFIYILLIATSFFTAKSFAQNIAINEDGSVPNPNAILDIKSFTKGILIPRVSTTARLAIPNTKGLLVYDSTASLFFYNTGTAWQSLSTSGGSGWLLNGNNSIDPSNQFIGTTDNLPLRFRVNNTWAGELHPATGNISFGLHAGQNNATGYSNIAIGADALKLNTTRSNLVAIGDSALFHNGSDSFSPAEGSFNTAIGSKSLFSNTTGQGNTATGHQSLFFNTTGLGNTAIGVSALFHNTTGSSNTANGGGALSDNTSGFLNVAIGTYALTGNSDGAFNTGVGGFALELTRNSRFNVAVGYQAGTFHNMGYNNTIIGADADVTGDGFFNCVALGESSRCTASNQVRIGNSATTSIGGYADWTNISDGRYKKNIKEDVKGIDFIMKLRPVTYQLDISGLNQKLNDGRGKELDDISKKSIAEREKTVFTGFVAQEVEKAAKEAGYDFSGVDIPKSENEFYGLRYAEFVVPLVKAVQEQQRVIVDLQKQIAELKLQVQRSK